MPILCESRVYSRNSIPVRIIILQGTVHWVAFQIPLTSIKGINTTGKWTLDLLLVTVEILKKDWKSDLWNVNVQGTHYEAFRDSCVCPCCAARYHMCVDCHHEESAAISMTKTGILPSCVHVKSFMCTCTLYIYIPKIATNTVHDTTCTMVYGCQFIHPIYMYTTITYIQTCVHVHDIINYWSVYYLGDHFWYL